MENKDNSQIQALNDFERFVIEQKGTEPPFTGEYYQYFEPGTYHCRKCDAPLFDSSHKFHSGCGWPAFDSEMEKAVTQTPDKDGRRTEITCSNCGAHLGHVFFGEGFTDNNKRHCVNSVSLAFKPAST
jgi:peptide-methionine (R)-S-oxide reductase